MSCAQKIKAMVVRMAVTCDHAQIFCVHGLIHAHRKSRVIGVRMAMCTSKPIIGKDASWGIYRRDRKEASSGGK